MRVAIHQNGQKKPISRLWNRLKDLIASNRGENGYVRVSFKYAMNIDGNEGEKNG